MTTHMNTNMNNFFSELQEYEFSKKLFRIKRF